MMLTALRREELALAQWSEFDSELTLFTVPTARVKLKASAKLDKKPVYKVPLPPLAQRILKGLRGDGAMVFPGLDANRLKEKLVAEGAPEDFLLHTFRHTGRDLFRERRTFGMGAGFNSQPRWGRLGHGRVLARLPARTETQDADGMGGPRRAARFPRRRGDPAEVSRRRPGSA
jgi:hypothetical protein